jgi:hypothetical protein
VTTLISDIAEETQTDRFWRLAAVTLTAIVCLYVSTVQLNGVDFWLQAKIGEITVRDGAIPGTLLFPFTEIATQRFNAHEWLSSILFHLLLSNFGEDRMPFITGIAGLVFLCLAARLAYLRNGCNTPVALLLGIVALMTENYRHVMRPELVSLLFMGWFWIALEHFKAKPHWKYAVISTLIVILWANSHGSFILAPALTTIYATGLQLDRIIRRRWGGHQPVQAALPLAVLGSVHLLACLVNPFGVELLAFVVGFSNDAAMSNIIAEWSPTLERRWLTLPGFWFAGVVWIGTLAVILKNMRRLSAVDALLFLFFSCLAVKAIRFPVYLGLMSAAVCAPYIAPKWFTWERQCRLFQGIAGLVVALGVAALLYGNAQGRHPYSTGVAKLSDQMVRTLENPVHKGNVYTTLELGAELIFRAYPRLRPSIDCRIDSYGLAYLEAQEQLLNSDEQLQEFVRRYDVRYMLMDRAGLNDALQKRAWRADRWTVVDMDRTVVFLKRSDLTQ